MNSTICSRDEHYMQIALRLSKQHLGLTAPNPSVGCVLVKENRIIATGVTARYGRPHAERIALDMAGADAKGATAYVTLEPCSHKGKTASCAQALIDAAIERVVIAIRDPNPLVNGKGIAMLQAHGVKVTEDIGSQVAYFIQQGFLLTQTDNRPLITLKTATSMDGKIALKNGQSQWITAKDARKFGHYLRASHDAIMVGSGTVLADDPSLNCRLEGRELDSPIRVIMDRRLRIQPPHKLIQTATEIPTIIVTEQQDSFAHKGVELIIVEKQESLKAILKRLKKRGITRLLIEGGGTLAASFIKAGLIDRIYWIQSNKIIGNDGLSAIESLNIDKIASLPNYSTIETKMLGSDRLTLLQSVRD